MNCHRAGCGDTCDRHSWEFGPICDSCFDELVSKGIGTNIQVFMESVLMDKKDDENSRTFFDRIFQRGRSC